MKEDIIFRLNDPATTSATTTTTLGMSTSLSVPGVATTTSESVTTHNQSLSATSSAPGVATTTSPVTTHNQSSSATSLDPGVATTTSSVTTSNTITPTVARPTSAVTASYSTRSTTSVRRITRSTTYNIASIIHLHPPIQHLPFKPLHPHPPLLDRRKRKRGQQSEGEGEEESEKCEAFIYQMVPSEKEVKTRSWIVCETCKKWLHFYCVGIRKAPPEDYNCGCKKRQINLS